MRMIYGDFKVGDVVQHYRRTFLKDPTNEYLYIIVAFGRNCSSEKDCVIYRALYGEGETFVRDVDDFMGTVGETLSPHQRERFKKVSL